MFLSLSACVTILKAEVIVWDFETCAVYAKLVLHRNSVEAVSFTYNDKYLVSLGGQDDARCNRCYWILQFIEVRPL